MSARIRKQKIFQLEQDDSDPDARIIKDRKGKVVTTINIFIKLLISSLQNLSADEYP